MMDLPEYSNVVCWWGGASCPSPEGQLAPPKNPTLAFHPLGLERHGLWTLVSRPQVEILNPPLA